MASAHWRSGGVGRMDRIGEPTRWSGPVFPGISLAAEPAARLFSCRSKMNRAEGKTAGLNVTRMRLPSGMALTRRRCNREHGEVGVDVEPIARPGGQDDDHVAEMAGARLGAAMNV